MHLHQAIGPESCSVAPGSSVISTIIAVSPSRRLRAQHPSSCRYHPQKCTGQPGISYSIYELDPTESTNDSQRPHIGTSTGNLGHVCAPEQNQGISSKGDQAIEVGRNPPFGLSRGLGTQAVAKQTWPTIRSTCHHWW